MVDLAVWRLVAVAEGDSHTVRPCGFTRTNYRFTGWNTQEDGSETAYQPNSTIANVAADVDLYAQWLYIDNNNHNQKSQSSYSGEGAFLSANVTITIRYKTEDGITVDTEKVSVKRNSMLSERDLKLLDGYELKNGKWSHKAEKTTTVEVIVIPNSIADKLVEEVIVVPEPIEEQFVEKEPSIVAVMTIGSTTMSVNQRLVEMDTAPLFRPKYSKDDGAFAIRCCGIGISR